MLRNCFLIETAILLLASQSVVAEGKASPASRPTASEKLVLSELTVDRPPGQDGSWVELYHPGTNMLEAAGVTISCNGRTVFTVPPGVTVPPKGLLLIRFARGKRPAVDTAASFRQANSATLWATPAPPARKGEDGKKRRPGYCAVFASPKQGSESICDYVQWGRDGAHKQQALAWAAKARLWPPDAVVYVGVNPRPGDRPVPRLQDGAVLCRFDFSPQRVHRVGNHCVRPERMATPGRGNTLPPPDMRFPWPGAGIAADQDLLISVGMRVVVPEPAHVHGGPETGKGKDEKKKPEPGKPFRVQLARDPHFREIAYDGRFSARGVIKRTALAKGKYFARVRLDGERVSTSWSEPIFFGYE